MIVTSVISLILMAQSLSSADRIEAAIMGRSIAGVLIQSGESDKIMAVRLYQRGRVEQGNVLVTTWYATASDLEADDEGDIVSSATCPLIKTYAEQLAEIGIDRLVSPPTAVPPRANLHGNLYTIWGNSRATDESNQTTRVTTSSGPIAEWAERMVRTVEECKARHDGPAS